MGKEDGKLREDVKGKKEGKREDSREKLYAGEGMNIAEK